MASLLLAGLAAGWLAGWGCEGTGRSGGNLLNLGGGSGEKWTIRCLRSETPNHAATCNQLAEMLRKVNGLQARHVRVASDAKGSTLYYGEYTKVASSETGRLVFPRQYQNDISLIQHLAVDGYPVFQFAKPEPIDRPQTVQRGEWDVAHAKGAYTLLIGVFYNTPTFDQRRQAAEEYVKLLREDGLEAFYRHELVKSFVYVGNFEESDLVKAPAGVQNGPRVEQLIARREEEFRHLLENGYRVKRTGPDGQMVIPPSVLVPVPRDEPK